MRTLGLAIPLFLVLAAPALVQPAFAQTAAPTAGQAAQRERMKTCNADAGTQKLTGDARKGFMADCLAGKSAAAPAKTLTPQQEKMKSCNADASAKSLKGKDRRTFLSTCLKG
ncbi:PsiF family protein [Methylobacterium planeticum]|uniref:Phosphate-starvation-inducible protein PsiF n=1 Tax=Methylobacterium planeticum TaxID=2615211 RepID=A0A6N6MR17_9HYPH|nr:PsiF family protein [Methylobacterium planeticum]KAB1072578.1 phosphate-starvation-inducible protein PsiF [Methylobacterium planeticum]